MMTYEFIIGFLIGAFVLYMVVDIWNYKKIKKYDVFLEISSPALKIIAQRIKNYEESDEFEYYLNQKCRLLFQV